MAENILEFPLPDRPITESEVDKLHSQAFRDLEFVTVQPWLTSPLR